MKLKFVIWGFGFKGKRIFSFLGSEKVVAIIESNPCLINTNIADVPIVDFKGYLEAYSGYTIIVSPRLSDGILFLLQKHEITNYFMLSECPSEMQYAGEFNYFECILQSIDVSKSYVIYGFTLFSVLLYEFLLDKGVRKICILPHKELNNVLLDSIQKIHGNILFNKFEKCLVMADVVLLAKDVEIEKLNVFGINFDEAINVYDFSDKIESYRNKKIEKFKDIHRGKRCFIVATGPSLRFADLDVLCKNNEICISMNRIYCGFDNTNWRPDYYLVEDVDAIQAYTDDILKVDICAKFVADGCSSFWKEEMPGNIYKYHLHCNDYSFSKPLFSEDFSKKVYVGYTVTYSCIQLALYMGFNEVFLIGVDFNYSSDIKDKSNHFSENYYKHVNKVGFFAKDYSEIAYKTARIYAEKNGVKIYNATRGGSLEVFDRVDFDRLF